MKTTKTSLLSFMVIALVSLIAFSCSNEQENESLMSTQTLLNESMSITPLALVDPAGVKYCGNTKTVRLLAGQNKEAGFVIIGNDEYKVYVTYMTNNGWSLKAVHLHVSACDKLPLNNGGNPTNGNFLINESFDVSKTSVTYSFNLSDLPDCFCVLAHA